MNILHVIEGVDVRLGGLSYLLGDITSMEQLIGHSNEVVSIECEAQYVNKEIKTKIHLFKPSFPARFNNSDAAIDWLKSHIHSYDLLIIHSTWNILAHRASYVARIKKTPYVFWPHNSLDPFDLEKKNLLKSVLGPLFIRKHLNGAVAICSASKLESERLRTYGATTPRFELPYPVRYSNQEGNRQRFRDKYNLTDKDFTFLFLSRVDYKKGLDLAIRAFARLKEEVPNLKFMVAGPDTNGYSDYIQKLIKQLDLEDDAKMIGSLAGTAKNDAFLGADCFLLPSLNESFGIAVVEALQSGLPVLISNNVFIHEEISKLNGGWVCTIEVNDICKTMKRVVQDTVGYASTKKQAKEAGLFFSDINRLKNIYTYFYLSLK
jgi:glycosyltransferase involved in cell wall biosynthesis